METRPATIDPALLQLAWGRDDALEPELLAPAGPVGMKMERRQGEPVVALFESAREALKFFMSSRLRDLGVPHEQIRVALLRIASGLEAIVLGDVPEEPDARLLLWASRTNAGEPRIISVPPRELERLVISVARQAHLGGTDQQVLRWGSRCAAEAAHEFEDMPDPEVPGVRGEIGGRLLLKSPREGLEAFLVETDEGRHRVFCEPRPHLVPELRSLVGRRVVAEGLVLRGPVTGQPVVMYLDHARAEADRAPREIVRAKPKISTTGHSSGRGARAGFKWLREQSSTYAGQWVALRDAEVIDSDTKLQLLRERIRTRPDHDELRLLQVPTQATA